MWKNLPYRRFCTTLMSAAAFNAAVDCLASCIPLTVFVGQRTGSERQVLCLPFVMLKASMAH
jgi:hypothetical protein